MAYAELFSVSSTWVIDNLLTLLTAILVLVLGWYLAGFLSRQVTALLPRTQRFDTTITPLLAEVIRYGILVITLVIVLAQFGVQTASILAVLGAAGLAIALALQGTLTNIASGVMLIWLRPFNVGEYIDAEGIAGTVVEIGLFGTRLRTYDGIYVFAPNSRMWNAKIINYTREKTRMVEVKIGIGYESDMTVARAVLLGVAKDERVLSEPAPLVFIDNLGPIAIEVVMRVWVKGSDWWRTRVDLVEAGRNALQEAGIRLPYSRLDVEGLGQAGA